jgi:hypothetical protein
MAAHRKAHAPECSVSVDRLAQRFASIVWRCGASDQTLDFRPLLFKAVLRSSPRRVVQVEDGPDQTDGRASLESSCGRVKGVDKRLYWQVYQTGRCTLFTQAFLKTLSGVLSTRGARLSWKGRRVVGLGWRRVKPRSGAGFVPVTIKFPEEYGQWDVHSELPNDGRLDNKASHPWHEMVVLELEGGGGQNRVFLDMSPAQYNPSLGVLMDAMPWTAFEGEAELVAACEAVEGTLSVEAGRAIIYQDRTQRTKTLDAQSAILDRILSNCATDKPIDECWVWSH